MMAWKIIKEFKEYSANERGEVKSRKYNEERRLNPYTQRGYKMVSLMRGGKRFAKQVHRLVLCTFSKKPLNYPMCVNHKDCNGCNNNLNNLEWVTYSGNMRHASALGRLGKNKKPVYEIDKDGKIIGAYKSACHIEKELGIHNASINMVCNGRRKSTRGRFFRFQKN